MRTQSQIAFQRFKDVARRLGAFMQALDTSPLEAIDDRFQRLEVRLADLETNPASPATSHLGRDASRAN